jgi:hypothetical protein
MPFLFGLIFSFEIDGARIPIVLFAGHVAATLENENLFSRRREFVRESAAACAAADDNDVIMIIHCHVNFS